MCSEPAWRDVEHRISPVDGHNIVFTGLPLTEFR
jgi:hypothetical protein